MLTPQEVAEKSFTKAVMGGYNMAMVDDFLDELTVDYTTLYKENAALKGKMKVLVDKIEEYRSTEDGMRAALLASQKTASSMVAEAEARRQELLDNAEAEAAAHARALRQEVADQELRLAQLKRETVECINKVKALYNSQLAVLSRLDDLKAPPAEPVNEEPEGDPVADVAEAIEFSILQKLRDQEFVREPEAAPAKETDWELEATRPLDKLDF